MKILGQDFSNIVNLKVKTVVYNLLVILGDLEVTANIYCKSPNFPNTKTQNYSTDIR